MVKISLSHTILQNFCVSKTLNLLSSQEQQQQQTPSLDDCLKLLKGERDEQRLAGLLLVTKFCNGDDLGSLRKVYNAVGAHFLDRLLRTGNVSSSSFFFFNNLVTGFYIYYDEIKSVDLGVFNLDVLLFFYLLG